MYTTSQFHYSKESKTFSVEISDIRSFDLSKHVGNNVPVTIKNPVTGRTMDFKFTHADMDGSQEDTYGWNFISSSRINLLIIND